MSSATTTLPSRWLGYVGPILMGAAIAVVGIGAWQFLANANARIRPDLPWGAAAMLAVLVIGIFWLHGAGPPRSWRAARRWSLRVWRPTQGGWSRDGIGVTVAILAMLALIYVAWIAFGAARQPPDLSEYPTTAFRFSVLIMGAVVTGVVEEVAFRGVMQSRLERFGAGKAIVITSIVFTLFHGVQGIGFLLLLGPSLFVASGLYGMLAYHTGSIVPGMIMHVLGDLAFFYFGLLGGDGSLLFAP